MALRKLLAATAVLAALGAAVPAAADGNAGAYLAARQATGDGNFRAAAEYYTRALIRDPSNPRLMDAAISAQVAEGEIDRAVPIATRLIEVAPQSQVAALVLFLRDANRGDWDDVLDALDEGRSVGPLFDGLLRAWALVGEGRMADAIDAFDAVTESRGVAAFGLYHKALALASVGDFEGAEALFSGEEGPGIALTRRGLIAHAQILGQLDRGEEGAALITDTFGPAPDPALASLRDALAGGDAPDYSGVTTAKQGVAEVAFSIAGALNGEATEGFTLVYSRAAEYLDPAHVDAILLSASILDDLGQYDLAVDAFAQVPAEHPSFHAAELGRAEALRRSGEVEQAIEALRQLTETHGDMSIVHTTLGDVLRREERFDEATEAYDDAIALFTEDEEVQWVVYFARGITHERSDRWPQAEADFRKALELRPDQPQVLNYLGYSFVEMQENMDEALEMIERAVEAEPESGYIVDSLGWVLYRLGRYDEALGHMERAVELMPVDPVVNDHLGDVYWAVGRYREAEFQWHRALSFIEPDESTDADPDRIRRKLEVGLDVVLEEEGAPPLRVANDGG